MKNMRKLVWAACLLVANANREAYGNWETYLNKHDRVSDQGVDTPFWKNYENWNQWVTEETPADLTPSKNGLDSWRKWNLGKMATYGDNWQSTFESQPKQENSRSEFEKAPKQGTDEWKEWMKTRFVEANNLMSHPHPRVERDYPVAEKGKQPFGPYHHPKEVPDVKDPTNSNQDDWQEMIPAAYRGLMSSKQPTPEEEKARQDGDVNWRNYVPKSYRNVAPAWGIHDGVSAPSDNDFAERYNDKHSPHNKAHHSDTSSKKDKHSKNEKEDYSKIGEEYAKKYTDENAKYAEKYGGVNPNGGGSSPDISKYTDWKKYVGDQGGNDWNKYIPGSNPSAGGGGKTVGNGPDGWENYGGGSYTDWKKFAGGYGPPMTLIAKPKPHDGEPSHPTSDDKNSQPGQPVDWHKYVPEAYRDFVPSDETINEANKNNAGGKPVDWRGFVPPAFRHYIPDNATIAEQEKGNHGTDGGRNEHSTTNTSPEVIIIVPQPEGSSTAKIGSRIQGEQDARSEKSKHHKGEKPDHHNEDQSTAKDAPSEKSKHHKGEKSDHHNEDQSKDARAEKSKHHKGEKPDHHNEDQSTAKRGSKIQHDEESHKHKGSEKHKGHKGHKGSEEDTLLQSEQLETSNLASVHTLPNTTAWSGVAIAFLSVTVLVGLFVGGYLFKRLKKRHFDYEQVAELDADQLLLV